MQSFPPVLEVQGLERRFGDVAVLSGVDFSLARAERIAITGPNGAGKSTLLRCIVGTLLPSGGGVRVCGHAAGSLAARRLLGASLSQERSFYLRLSGRRNLHFYARLRLGSARAAERTVEALEEELELGEILATRVDRCSTGMVQQLAFARALIGDPALLVLDEPTRSLDTAAVERFWGALERRSETSLVLATHDSGDLGRCGGRLDLT